MNTPQKIGHVFGTIIAAIIGVTIGILLISATAFLAFHIVAWIGTWPWP